MNVLIRVFEIPVAEFGEAPQRLSLFVICLDGPGGCSGVVCGDRRVDVPKSLLSFVRPVQLCDERMRGAMSSWVIVRPASESARPRSTILTKANSLRISS